MHRAGARAFGQPEGVLAAAGEQIAIISVMIYMPAMSTTSNGSAIVPGADNAVYMAPSGELQLDVRIDS